MLATALKLAEMLGVDLIGTILQPLWKVALVFTAASAIFECALFFFDTEETWKARILPAIQEFYKDHLLLSTFIVRQLFQRPCIQRS